MHEQIDALAQLDSLLLHRDAYNNELKNTSNAERRTVRVALEAKTVKEQAIRNKLQRVQLTVSSGICTAQRVILRQQQTCCKYNTRSL